MSDYLHAVVHLAEAHAGLIYVVAFVASCLESVAFVGLLVPGSAIIVALGALVPSGAVGFWWLCLWSILGAVAGDGLSYWLGRRYGDQLTRSWPFSRYPRVLAHGEQFFAAHGGKSVFLSRYVAPVRGVVPLVAGLIRMEPRRFVAIDTASALGWAPAHILPGVLVGAGLTLTNAVATRLLILVIALAGVLWLVAWIATLSVRRVLPLLVTAGERIEGWARRHRNWLARQLLALLDPAYGEARTLALLGVVLVGAAWTFFGVLEDVVTGDPLVLADTAIYNLLQGLRSQVIDRVMIGITELGGATVAGSVSGVVLLWLIWRRAWHAAVYWVAAVAGAGLIGLAIKLALHRSRPVPGFAGWDAFSFPSGHTITNAAIYGFLVVLLARGAAPAWQALVAGAAVLMVALIGFSRLYLGVHWFSDVVGGVAFGTMWIALLAIAYSRHNPVRLSRRVLAAIVFATVAGVGGLQIAYRMPADLEKYAARRPERSMMAAAWWRDGWRDVPLRRIDLVGEREEPLVLQWAGSLADLRGRLGAAGWRRPEPWSVASALNWLSPVTDPLKQPVLPRLHDGRAAALTLIHVDNGGGRPAARWVLRVWRAGVRLTGAADRARPLWLGAITRQHFEGIFAPIGIGFERSPAKVPWPLLIRALPAAGYVLRTDARTGDRVMLAHDSASPAPPVPER